MIDKIPSPNTLIEILDILPIGVTVLDRKKRVTYANQRAEMLFEKSINRMLNTQIQQLIYADSELIKLIQRVDNTGQEARSSRLKLQGPGRKAVLCEAIITPYHEPEGYIIALMPEFLFNDSHTPQSGLSHLGRLLGHEIKNPLAGISGAAQLLLRDADTQTQPLLAVIQEESLRIGRLVERFTSFELFANPKLELINIHEVLDRVILVEEVANHIQISKRYDPSLPDIMADSDHLSEAFGNLLRNACEAIIDKGGHGKVLVTTRYQAITKSHSGLSRGESGSLVVCFEDNGSGIAPEQMEQIFDMLYTTKTKGSGLGLSVVQDVITAHGGQLEFVSEEGQTQFSLYFPLKRSGAGKI